MKIIKNGLAWLLSLGLWLWISLSACKLLEAKSAKIERFECLIRALEPHVGEVLDAEQLVRDLYSGKADMNTVAQALQLTQAEIDAYNAAVDACAPRLPAGEAS